MYRIKCENCGIRFETKSICNAICPNCRWEHDCSVQPIKERTKMRRKRIYVAGSYSDDNVLGVLDNIRKGMRKGLEVLLKGFAPFVPWFDYHFQLMLREGEKLTVEDYYEYSMAWLEVSEAVLVLPNSKDSKGTQNEIRRAKELGIPVFYDLEELCQNLKKGQSTMGKN